MAVKMLAERLERLRKSSSSDTPPPESRNRNASTRDR